MFIYSCPFWTTHKRTKNIPKARCVAHAQSFSLNEALNWLEILHFLHSMRGKVTSEWETIHTDLSDLEVRILSVLTHIFGKSYKSFVAALWVKVPRGRRLRKELEWVRSCRDPVQGTEPKACARPSLLHSEKCWWAEMNGVETEVFFSIQNPHPTFLRPLSFSFELKILEVFIKYFYTILIKLKLNYPIYQEFLNSSHKVSIKRREFLGLFVNLSIRKAVGFEDHTTAFNID